MFAVNSIISIIRSDILQVPVIREVRDKMGQIAWYAVYDVRLLKYFFSAKRKVVDACLWEEKQKPKEKKNERIQKEEGGGGGKSVRVL